METSAFMSLERVAAVWVEVQVVAVRVEDTLERTHTQ
jgi:hypothetical protein